MIRPLLPVLLMFAFAADGLVAQHTTQGPLTSEEGAPLQRLGFTPSMEGAAITPQGVVRMDMWLSFGNMWEQDSSAVANLFLDVERLISAATLRVGVVPGLELGARATLERTGGGFMDNLVTGFHGIVGAGDRNRPDYPTNEYGQWLRDGDGTLLIEIPARGTPALEDVRFFAKWGAYASDDGRNALSVKAAARVPTAENTLGSERGDASLMLMGHTGWGGWYVHGLAGASTIRPSPELAAILRDRQWFFMAGAERPLREGLSMVMQVTGSTQLLRDIGDHDVDGAMTNVIFGMVGTTQGGWRWEASMQEDIPPRGPSADFAFQFSLGRAW